MWQLLARYVFIYHLFGFQLFRIGKLHEFFCFIYINLWHFGKCDYSVGKICTFLCGSLVSGPHGARTPNLAVTHQDALDLSVCRYVTCCCFFMSSWFYNYVFLLLLVLFLRDFWGIKEVSVICFSPSGITKLRYCVHWIDALSVGRGLAWGLFAVLFPTCWPSVK